MTDQTSAGEQELALNLLKALDDDETLSETPQEYEAKWLRLMVPILTAATAEAKLAGELAMREAACKVTCIRCERGIPVKRHKAYGYVHEGQYPRCDASHILAMPLTPDSAGVLERIKKELAQSWRCFHCGEVFTDETSAKEHFGASEYEVEHPACVDPLRADEKERLRVVSEMRQEIARVEKERDEYEIDSDNWHAEQNEMERLFGEGVRSAHHAWLRLEAAQNLAEVDLERIKRAERAHARLAEAKWWMDNPHHNRVTNEQVECSCFQCARIKELAEQAAIADGKRGACSSE